MPLINIAWTKEGGNVLQDSILLQKKCWFVERSPEWDTRLAGVPDRARSSMKSLLEDGIVRIEGSIEPAKIDDLLLRFRAFEKKNSSIFKNYVDQDGHYPRIINIHAVFPDFAELFTRNPKALELLDAIFGEESAIYTSLFFARGTAQDIHRDTPYFATKPEYAYFGVWVALEDTDEYNGPLMVIKGGHLVDELDLDAIASKYFPDPVNIDPNSPHLWMEYQAGVQAACAAKGLVVEKVMAKKGDTIIWHPQAPHGGSPILDMKRTRLSMVMHVTPVGVPVYKQDVFFNPRRDVSHSAEWSYIDFDGRKYANLLQMSFGHTAVFTPDDFER
jgi:phytanoyl-CoA hydroxylase